MKEHLGQCRQSGVTEEHEERAFGSLQVVWNDRKINMNAFSVTPVNLHQNQLDKFRLSLSSTSLISIQHRLQRFLRHFEDHIGYTILGSS